MSCGHLSSHLLCHLSWGIIQEQACKSEGFLQVLCYLIWVSEYQKRLKKAETSVLMIVYSKWTYCLERRYLPFLLLLTFPPCCIKPQGAMSVSLKAWSPEVSRERHPKFFWRNWECCFQFPKLFHREFKLLVEIVFIVCWRLRFWPDFLSFSTIFNIQATCSSALL